MPVPLTNMAFFNIVALAVLNKLHEEFPNPITLDIAKLAVETVVDQYPDVEKIRVEECAAQGRNIVTWLKEEGFLNTIQGTQAGDNFLQVRLTMRGLLVLDAVPSVVRTKEAIPSLGERMKALLKGGIKTAGTEALKAVGKEGASALMREAMQRMVSAPDQINEAVRTAARTLSS